jgi:hypothetical protein
MYRFRTTLGELTLFKSSRASAVMYPVVEIASLLTVSMKITCDSLSKRNTPAHRTCQGNGANYTAVDGVQPRKRYNDTSVQFGLVLSIKCRGFDVSDVDYGPLLLPRDQVWPRSFRVCRAARVRCSSGISLCVLEPTANKTALHLRLG